MVDTDEISIEETILSDFDEDEDDIGSNDDEIRDDEANPIFDKELNREIEHGNTVTCEPARCPQFGDEEKDSGIGESDASDIEGKAPTPPPSLLKVSRLFSLHNNL
jgi:hypothetical protein